LKWSLCTTGFKEQTLEEAAAFAHRIGLDGIEIWLGHVEDTRERDGSSDRLRDLLNHFGLAVPMISTYANFSKSAQESIQETQRALEFAAEIECPAVRIFAGHLPFGQVTPEEWERTASAIGQVMTRADFHGVNVAVEVHNHTFADCISGVEALLEKVGHPRLRLIFDGFNLYVDGRDQLEALHRLYQYIDHVHLKNYWWDAQNWENSVPSSVFTGDVDNRKLLGELISRGYEGYLSFEYFGEQKERCIQQSLLEVKEMLGKR